MNEFFQPRRKFLQAGILGLFSTAFSALTNSSFGRNKTRSDKGIFIREEEGIHILTGRGKIPITIKISKSQQGIESLSFCVEDMLPGRKMRVHKHLYNDELIFIHKGKGTLTLGDEIIQVKTGDLAFIPRDTWHGLDNSGAENLKMIFQYTPAGFEQYFIENGTEAGTEPKEKKAEEYKLVEKKYGMEYREKA